MMRISYTNKAEAFLQQIREKSEDAYHSLRGLVVLLSTGLEIGGYKKGLMDSGSGKETPVCAGEDWRIVYRIDGHSGEEILRVIVIWDPKNPPNTRM